MDTNQQKAVEIRPDVLSSILSSIDTLQREVSKLRKDNDVLNSEVRKLRGPRGRFSVFPKLPIEIRQSIWRLAINEPKFYTIERGNISCSQPNIVTQSCREARRMGLELGHSSYYRVWIDHPWQLATRRHHFNPDLDIIYVPKRTDVRSHVNFFCKECPDRPSHSHAPITENNDCNSPHQISRVALHYDIWEDPIEMHPDDNAGRCIGEVDLLIKWNVRELILVVGNKASCDPDVVFIEPTLFPTDRTLTNFGYDAIDRSGGEWEMRNPKSAWEVVARHMKAILQEYRDTRTELRRVELEENKKSTEEIDQWDNFLDISSWEIPRIKFVEAVSPARTKWWVHRIPNQLRRG